MKKRKVKSETVQSLIAVVIALIAVFISIWQGYEQRRHNRLSVKPILTFDAISHNNYKSIRLSNDGLGPAIVKRFIISEKGTQFDASEGNPWTEIKQLPNIQYSEMYYFDDGATIKPNEHFNLLTWEADSIRILDIELLIEYESIYEESFELSSGF